MAGRIKQEDVEAVRERTDIVKLVSQYLTLKKAGGDNMVPPCSFRPRDHLINYRRGRARRQTRGAAWVLPLGLPRRWMLRPRTDPLLDCPRFLPG